MAAYRVAAGNSALTAEGSTSKGTGSISCEVEFCIFYRLSLRTLRTNDVDKNNVVKYSVIQKDGINFVGLYFLNYTWYVNDLHNI
jgi:hypothetical protein